jgi:hypothetical protein
LLPLLENTNPQPLQIEDETKKDVYLNWVLTQHYLFELGEGQFIYSETYDIREDGKQSGIILAVCGT